MHGKLDVLSEQYIQNCLQLGSSQQSSQSRETTLACKERELEHLRTENQVYANFILNTHCKLYAYIIFDNTLPGAED